MIPKTTSTIEVRTKNGNLYLYEIDDYDLYCSALSQVLDHEEQPVWWTFVEKNGGEVYIRLDEVEAFVGTGHDPDREHEAE